MVHTLDKDIFHKDEDKMELLRQQITDLNNQFDIQIKDLNSPIDTIRLRQIFILSNDIKIFLQTDPHLTFSSIQNSSDVQTLFDILALRNKLQLLSQRLIQYIEQGY